MKIALVYSGQPRDIKECFPNHWETFWKTNEGCEVDVFAHMWNDEGGYFWDDHKVRGKWESWQVPFMQENWRPKGLELEQPKVFESDVFKPDPRFPHPINNTISMMYSLYKANELKKKYEEENNFKYDCVVRLRTDTLFFSKVGPLKDYDLDYCYVKNVYAHTDYGIDDQFAFSNSENMDKYFDAYENIYDNIQDGCAINPETLMGWNLQVRHKVKTIKSDINHRLWRDKDGY